MDLYRISAGDNKTFRHKQNFETSEFDLSGLNCILSATKTSSFECMLLSIMIIVEIISWVSWATSNSIYCIVIKTHS